ncbi:MAG: SDR family oxidoreductase [Rhodospirillaceae bacterium]|nr:SDR family oxidoreductase [Rhodospirillaceae bacterium]
MFKPFDLAGKVALITGGNGGIGLGMAAALAEAGADLAIWGTNAEKNAAAKARLAASGRRVEAIEVNVADEAAAEAGMAETLARLGRVDACFANAGVSGYARSMFEIDGKEWRRVLGINLDGAFFTLRAAARHMRARAEQGDPGGRLVGIASLAARSGAARNEHYAATKGGLVSMLKAMAVELARYGITANALLPGWIETEMTAPTFANEKFRANVMPRLPMRRYGKPEDFGGIAVYLASAASAYHTGDEILIDGGYWVF